MPDSPAAAVVVNYNARDALVACLASLRSEGVETVVVVDNDSQDGSAEAVAAADPDARFIATGANLGYGTAANRGVREVDEPYVMVLNPDVVVEPGTVKALVDALERDPRLAVVGPRVEEPDGSLYPSARRFPELGVAAGHAFLGYVAPRNRWSRAYKLADWDHSHRGEVDWVSGSCLMARRSAYQAVGGFDEDYFMYAEDVDLCWRTWQAGWRVAYEPEGRVVHTGGVSTDQAPYRMILEHHRSLWRFARKSASGRDRLALPAVAAGLGARTALSWGQRAYEGWRSRP
ncbi:MAG: glycosyltransferase family 2 protein [Actinomycetota bacterium]|jgi:N-acetylglucosaminyl-diphospho-decaprenol L-rhamnosyltransferase